MVWQFVGEASAVLRARLIVTTVLLVALSGAVWSVAFLGGQSAAFQSSLAKSLTSAQARTIAVRFSDTSGVNSSIVARTAQLDDVVWAGAFSPAKDVTNAGLQQGARVAYRNVWWRGSWPSRGLVKARGDGLYGNEAIRLDLKMQQPIGIAVSNTGERLPYNADMSEPAFLKPVSGTLLRFRTDESRETVTLLLIVAKRQESVPPLVSTLRSTLGLTADVKASVESSSEQIELQRLVDSNVGLFRGVLMAGVSLATAIFMGLFQTVYVLQLRRDFGRRRALGATRLWIVSAVQVQAALLSMIALAIGFSVALISLAATGSDVPELPFFLSVGFLFVLAVQVATVIPSILAATRDPVKELRVP